MKVSDLQNALTGSFVQPVYDDCEIKTFYTSDLLSDVIAHAAEGSVLVTVQAHINTAAVAFEKRSPAVIVCNGRQIPDDMISAARSHKLAVFLTEKNQFEVSGILFSRI